MEIQSIKPVLLIIDDEELVRGTLAELFSESGFCVIQAHDGREGIDMARAMRPEIVITDLIMPDVGGLEVVDAVRRMDDNLPIIVLSGTGVLADAVMSLRRGAWDYLAKPLSNLAELEHAVERCLERARQIRKNREQLIHQATHDALTGLPNRFYTQKFLTEQLERMDRNSQYLSLMLLDIDNLKFVNDTFGHDFGDLLLREVAGRLKGICQNDCTVTRFMGDKFIIIPPLSDGAEDAMQRAERVRSAMSTVFTIEGTEVVSTASIGVVVYPEDGECAEKLLKNAEAALSAAKKLGRNRIAFYTRELNSLLEQRFAMKTRLHKAMERCELSLQYQPQIDIDKGTVVGVEALLRWTPAGEASVPPATFVPLLEESGLIVEVGEWVLWQACAQAIEWQKQGLQRFRVSVNISALQFIGSDLDATVKRVLAVTGLDPGRLCLELTESLIMIDSGRTLEILSNLKETGVILSLDDFGTGYSSLEYLGRLPINELKIDMSFIRRMLTTKNDAAVVTMIIAMAQSLEMGLIAEGVETKEQLDYLREKKCHTIQGFIFSKPLSPDELVTFCRMCR